MSASTPHKDPSKTADVVELAEQLKASLDEPANKPRPSRPTAGERARDAELHALLREQLGGQTAPRTGGLMDMISAELADFELEEPAEEAPAAESVVADTAADAPHVPHVADAAGVHDVTDAVEESFDEPDDEPDDESPDENDAYTEDDVPSYDELMAASDEELPDEELPDEELSDEELSDEEIFDEEISDEKLPDEELPTENDETTAPASTASTASNTAIAETEIKEKIEESVAKTDEPAVIVAPDEPAEATETAEPTERSETSERSTAVETEVETEYERFTSAPMPAPEETDVDPWSDTACAEDDRINGRAVAQALSDTVLRDLDEDTRALIQRLREARVGVSSHEADLAIAETFDRGELDGQMDVFTSMDAMEALGELDTADTAPTDAPATPVAPAPTRCARPIDPLQVGPDKPDTETTVSLPDDYWLVKDCPATVLLTDAPADEVEDDLPNGDTGEVGADATAPSGTAADGRTAYVVAEEADEQCRDTELFIRLGYEAEINREDDATHVDMVKADYIRSTEADRIGSRNVIPAVYDGKEYHGRVAETAELEVRYDRAVRSAKAGAWFAILCTLCGLCYDLLPRWVVEGSMLATFVNARLYQIGGMLLLILCCIPFVTRLLRGWRSLMDFEPVAYAVPCVAVFFALFHGIVSICLPDDLRRPVTFVGAALCTLWPAVCSDLLTALSERRSFMVVSSGKRKYVVTEMADTPSALDESAHRRSDGLLVKKTHHVVDFFMWANRYHTRWGQLNYLIPLSVLGALLSAVVVVLAGGSVAVDGLHIFVTAALSALPASLAIVLTLPLFRTNRIIAEQGSTVVGAASAEIYAASGDPGQATRLIFGDGAALKATAIKEITIKEEPRTETYRQMAQRIFALLGNPLDQSYNDTYRHGADGLRLEIAEARPNYAKMYLVNTRRREAVEVVMGTHAELTALGIHLPEERLEQVYKKSPGSRVLYMVFDGKLRLMYATEYRIRTSFASTVHALGQDGYAPVVTTCDPLVTEGIMQSRLLRGAPAVTTVRTTQYEDVHEGESSGLISTGRATDIAYPLRACRVMRKTYRLGAALQWPTLLLPVLLLTMVGVWGQTAWLPSVIPAVWQTICTIGMALLIAGRVNREHLSIRPANATADEEGVTTPKTQKTKKTRVASTGSHKTNKKDIS